MVRVVGGGKGLLHWQGCGVGGKEYVSISSVSALLWGRVQVAKWLASQALDLQVPGVMA